jgi:hypothetical protein
MNFSSLDIEGMDVGEQDGRYVGRYASQVPPALSRQQQHLYFFRHFDRMAEDLGDKLSCLTSLYMPHYLMKVLPSILHRFPELIPSPSDNFL